MAERKFSELTAAAVLTDADILAISQIDSATASLMSKRTTLIAIANKLASLTNYTSELTTQDKTLTGAINELKGLISLIPHFGIEVVQTLPTEDISETTIYMTPSQNPQTQDAYDEFIYVNDAWEHVGSTAVDLSAYYTKLEVDGLLATKANTADVSAALALKENTADMEDDVTDIIVDLTDTQETSEGNPVTLQTVQEGYAKAVTIKLTPKQDLHGYDKPWPGGAGKNKIDVQGGSIISSGYIFNLSGLSIPAGEYTLSMVRDTTSNVSVAIVTGETTPINTSTSLPFTFSATDTITGIRVYSSVAVTFSNVQLEAGATATAYEPYANICPIEGYEEASATRTGVNQWDEEWESGGYSQADGTKVTSATQIRSKNKTLVAPSTTYYNKSPQNIRVFFYGKDEEYISSQSVTGNSTFTTLSKCHYITFHVSANYGTTYNNDISINYPATDTEYHAYDGATATAEFPETIYGATGDIAGGEWGKTFPKIDLGTLTWTYDSTYSIFKAYVNPPAKQNASCMCDRYEYSSLSVGATRPDRTINVGLQYFSSSFNVVSVKDTSYTSAADFKTAMSGVEFSYELATSVPFQTAPAPLTLRKGDNTITTDGDSVKVKYNKLALPDIGGIGRYISALEARVAALEGNGNRSLSLMKSAPIETKEEEPTEENGEEIQEEPKEETKNENASESK